jgi:hypothetical protein
MHVLPAEQLSSIYADYFQQHPIDSTILKCSTVLQAIDQFQERYRVRNPYDATLPATA